MPRQTIDLHVNPAEEAIRLGPLAVHFLITAENSNGCVAAFEVTVPVGSVWRRCRIWRMKSA